MNGHVTLTQPYAEPVSLAEAKQHCRVDIDADDSLIQSLIAAAREYVQTFTSRQIVVAGFQDQYEQLVEPVYKLRGLPLRAITTVDYIDDDGDDAEVPEASYEAVTVIEPGYIRLVNGASWPTDQRAGAGDVSINYIAGHVIPFTADAAADTITTKGLALTDGQIIRLTNSGGTLPAGLATFTDYHVVNASGATCQLSLTSGGGEIDITNTGTGTQFIGEVPTGMRQAMLLLISHWYEHREAVASTTMTEVPLAVETLLWAHRILEFA